ncbi:Phosphoserine phosphatase [thiotrophic endosymbiont of Bathymodiolus puteoserpentis (Logatchev)]|nr:Phosphoserine phosphatase [thiotrophic endosymbiont of Bathymodiolus puteoserpentis (Logatchev)]
MDDTIYIYINSLGCAWVKSLLMNTIILHTQDLVIANKMADAVGVEFESRATHFRFSMDKKINIAPLREALSVDINYLPAFDFSKAGLFVSDMDSTLINIECIDEIADFVNLKAQVAAITKRAMQGELDFNASLIERVALFKGLDVSVLNQVYTERLGVSSGGRELIQFFKTQGIKTAVVSGGFKYFTQRLAQDIGLDHDHANELTIKNNQLTGKVDGDIVNATTKAKFVTQLCRQYQISLSQAIVAGDGANDLEMMKIAGLSVAYHAKPIVAKQANIVIDFGGLDIMIDFFDG